MKNTYSGISAAFLLLTILLVGCGNGDGVTSSTPPTHPELLFVSDAYTLKTAAVSGSTSTELGSATIPGIPGTYVRTGTLVTVTIPNHQRSTGNRVDLVFSSGTGGTATSGQYLVTVVDANNFTIDDSASGTITGGAVLRKPVANLAAMYDQPGTTTVTVTFTNHGLSSGDSVKLHFTSGTATDITKSITVVDPNTFTVTAASAATTSGNVTVSIGSNYTIFGIAMHPSGKWVYVTSTYENDWGDGLISRFAVDWTTGALTFEKSVRDQVNTSAAPVTLNFSADGTLLFNQDDDLDGIIMYGVDATNGDLSLLGSAAGTSMHGVGVSADGTRVYNGSSVFTVDALAPSITNTYSDNGGDSNVIVGNSMFVADTADVIAYSISAPDLPTLITSATTGNQEAREVAASANGTRLVSSGWCGLMSFDYDGANITPAAAAGSNEYVGCAGGVWLAGGTTRQMFRNLSINNAGNMIATAYFTQTQGASQGGGAPSGYKLINLAADGSLSLATDYANNYYSRVATFFKKP